MRRDSRGSTDGKKRRPKTMREQLAERFPEFDKTVAEEKPRLKSSRHGRPLLRSSHTRCAALYAGERRESPLEVALRLRRKAEELCRQALGSVWTTRGWLLPAG
ncbi:hypothetical protein EPN90_02320 [Patescibacteria group bacterium]|nr:MAG: hypothetical protein EPN90_02320 [Patescibacteria group bacterium]